MRVAVVDCSVSGHRETYYREFARAWAALGHEVLLVAPRPSGTEGFAAFRPADTRPLLPLPAGKPLRKKLAVLRNAFVRWQNLARLGRALKDFRPGLVCFPCLDDLLPTWGPAGWFPRLFPYAWSGLLVQSALPAFKRFVPDVRPYLGSPLCRGIGVLNEYSADALRPFQPRICVLPDFADLSQPDAHYPLSAELRRRAEGRKVVSLLGSIGERKGIRLLLDVMALLPADEYFFLVAGKSWLAGGLLQAVQDAARTRGNCLFSLEHIPDEACFNALVAASDVLFAVYRHFAGSSNLLTKAAAFSRPVVVARGECMGKRVERYGIGLSVPETDAEACRQAIVTLCRDGAPRPDGFRAYAEAHSVEHLGRKLAGWES